jgi:phage regulator Rha-like protein
LSSSAKIKCIAKTKQLIKLILTDEVVISKVYLIRKQKVMLDKDLAEMYGVETKVFNQAVKRNIERFPKDFMFQLTKVESEAVSRSQIVTLKQGQNIKFLPYAFTEQGVSMLSGVLNSAIAIQVHIQIIKVFTKMKEMLLTNKDILLKLEQMEKDVKTNKQDIAIIFEALK